MTWHLPAELLDEIIQYLVPADLRRLRATSRWFRDIFTPAAFCTLTTSNTLKSIYGFSSLIYASDLKNLVKEVVFEESQGPYA